MGSSEKIRKGFFYTFATLLPAALGAALVWCGNTYVNWNPRMFYRSIAVVTLIFAALTLLRLWMRGERGPLKLALKALLGVAIFTGVLLLGVLVLINNVIGYESLARQAAAAAFPLTGAYALLECALLFFPFAGKSNARAPGRRWRAVWRLSRRLRWPFQLWGFAARV